MRPSRRLRPRTTGFVGLVVLAMLAVVTVPGAQAADEADRVTFGAEAADELGDDLAEVAEGIGAEPDAVEDELREDHTLAVDPNGELLFVDPPAPGEDLPAAPAESGAESGPEAAPPTTDPVFSLHSRPGADHTIYLDFDGYVTTGTSWNNSSGVDPIVSPPYDIDGDPTTWNSTELYRIEQAWLRASEDFRPFDVNVTTQDPGSAALRDTGGGDTEWGIRVVTTDDTFSNCGCGGQAYIGSFDDYYDEPAFVYNRSTTGVAEAVSHEVGHTMLLAHDGTSSAGYYTGHGGGGAPGWAPLMGASYYQPVTTFSQGEYHAANNDTASANFGFGPDDTAIIASLTNGNGFGLRPDDHGDDTTSGTSVTASAPVAGVIETDDDVDVFTFTTSGGPVAIDVDPPGIGANLDVRAELLDAGGGSIAVADGPATLGADLSATVGAGTYHVTVEGTGAGTPLADPPTGYTDYGSLGQYSLDGDWPTGPTVPLSGTVTADGTGAPVDGVWVAAVGPFPAAAELVAGTYTDATGSWSMPDLPDGDYLLVFIDPDLEHEIEYHDDAQQGADGNLVTVAAGSPQTVDAGLAASTPPTAGSETLTGTVTSTAGGAALDGVLVFAIGDSGIAGLTTTDGSGTYSLDLDPGTYLLEFVDGTAAHRGEWHEDHGLAEIALADPVVVSSGTTTVDADLEPVT